MILLYVIRNITKRKFTFQVVAMGMIERRKGGAIVHISSLASKKVCKEGLTYCVSKAALDQAMRVMTLELGPHQV